MFVGKGMFFHDWNDHNTSKSNEGLSSINHDQMLPNFWTKMAKGKYSKYLLIVFITI